MRQERRIGIILPILKDNRNKYKVLNSWFDSPHIVLNGIVEIWDKNYDTFCNFWVDNPDLRLPQVLINIGIMPNFHGFYYHKEDAITMIDTGLLFPEEILFWGNNYDKDNNRLSETRWVLPTEMTKGHLEAIIDLYDNGKMRVSEVYIEMFKKELKNREL